MKTIHRRCGGEIEESKELPPYISEDCGIVPAYQCTKCKIEIVGSLQMELVPESEADKIQVESFEGVLNVHLQKNGGIKQMNSIKIPLELSISRSKDKVLDIRIYCENGNYYPVLLSDLKDNQLLACVVANATKTVSDMLMEIYTDAENGRRGV